MPGDYLFVPFFFFGNGLPLIFNVRVDSETVEKVPRQRFVYPYM